MNVWATDKDGYLYICRFGIDGDWIRIWGLISEVTFRRHRMFCSCPVAFHRINMDRPEERALRRVLPKPYCDRDFEGYYVVESCGELLVVTPYRPYGVPPDDSKIKFRVHRWEKREEEEEEEFVTWAIGCCL